MSVRYESGPTTYLEEEWFRATPDGLSNFSLPLVLRIDGPLDRATLQEVIIALVQRHEALRTAFRQKGPGIERIILEKCEPELPMIDISDINDAERSVERLVISEAGQMMDLTLPPLWRGVIAKVAKDRHLAIFLFHHAIFDGWSGNVFRRDFTWLYKAKLACSQPRLPNLAITLGEYAAWERSVIRPEDSEEYWREQSPRRPQALPTCDFEGPTVMAAQTYRTIPSECITSIEGIASRCGATTANGMRATVLAALAPYLGDGVTIGFLMAARLPETTAMIGVFADHVIVRCDLGDNPTFWQVISRLAESTARAKRYSARTGLIRALSPDDRRVDVSINYLPAYGRGKPARVSDDPAVDISVMPIPMESARPKGILGCPGVVPVAYMLRHEGDGAVRGDVVGCAYRWARPSASAVAVINGLAREFTATVERAALHPEYPIGRLSGN